MMFKLIVDAGKPYDIEIRDGDELREELNKLKHMAESDEDLDVIVLNSKGEDITNDPFIQELIRGV